MGIKLTLLLEPQPEGVFTVTCEELPPLITEGDSIDEALKNAIDCFFAVCEAYQALKKPLPQAIIVDDDIESQRFQTVTPKNTPEEKPIWFQATLPGYGTAQHAI